MGKFNVLEYSTGKIINSPSEIEWCVHTTNSSRTIRLKVRLVGLLTGSPGKAKASSSSHMAGTSVSYDSKTEKKTKKPCKTTITRVEQATKILPQNNHFPS